MTATNIEESRAHYINVANEIVERAAGASRRNNFLLHGMDCMTSYAIRNAACSSAFIDSHAETVASMEALLSHYERTAGNLSPKTYEEFGAEAMAMCLQYAPLD